MKLKAPLLLLLAFAMCVCTILAAAVPTCLKWRLPKYVGTVLIGAYAAFCLVYTPIAAGYIHLF